MNRLQHGDKVAIQSRSGVVGDYEHGTVMEVLRNGDINVELDFGGWMTVPGDSARLETPPTA